MGASLSSPPTFGERTTFSVLLAPGEYDLFYQISGSIGDSAPTNENAKVATGVIIGSEPIMLKVDVLATRVTATFAVGGTPVVGKLVLRNADGDSAQLYYANGAYTANVVRGSYDLYYSSDGADLPLNGELKAQSDVVVGASPLNLEVALPAAKVSGKVTVNGNALSSPAHGKIEFRSTLRKHLPIAAPSCARE